MLVRGRDRRVSHGEYSGEDAKGGELQVGADAALGPPERIDGETA
jgi:hypothetical protein